MDTKFEDMVSVCLVPLEADPKTGLQIWVVSLKGGPRKCGRAVGKGVREGKEASESAVPSQWTWQQLEVRLSRKLVDNIGHSPELF